MKKILILAILLLASTVAFAADVETGQVADLYEQAYGRRVTAGTSELVTIWYTGNSPKSGFGVSASTIVFYENGTLITALRFAGAASVNFKTGASANLGTEGIVQAINSDTSGYFHAALGRDATPSTATTHFQTDNAKLYIANTEEDAITSGDVIVEDAGLSNTLRAGFRGKGGVTNRLKWIEDTSKGTGVKSIKIWDGEECVYERAYSLAAYTAATPVTVSFTNYGAKGLSAHKENNLTVTSEWTTALTTITDTESQNLSIIVGEWRD